MKGMPVWTHAVGMVLTLAACSSSSTTTSSSNAGGTESLGSLEDALSTDNAESQEVEDGAEEAIEDGLSGATAADPGSPADGPDLVQIEGKVKTNPGLYFKPAACISTTKDGQGKFTHTFKDCTGPSGKLTYNGVVESTWKLSDKTLEVVHQAKEFKVKGPSVTSTFSGSRTVTYTRPQGMVSKHRVGQWTGTLSKNSDPSKSVPWSHQADFTSTWTPSSKCFTRDGEAKNTVGDREFTRKVAGYRVCGGLYACPQSGEWTLSRKDGGTSFRVTFSGGPSVALVGPRGNQVQRKLACTSP